MNQQAIPFGTRIPLRKDVFVMIDIEASGTRLGYHDMIQFGAVAVGGPNLSIRSTFPVFQPKSHLPINLIAPQFKGPPDPGAMKVNGLKWDEVIEYGEPPQSFVNRFHEWCVSLKTTMKSDKIILTGHGMVFDWSYVRLLYNVFREDWPCHYSGLDFKSWYGGMRGVDYVSSSMTDMRSVFGIGANKKAHDAQADAEYQLEFMLRAWDMAGLIKRDPPPSA